MKHYEAYYCNISLLVVAYGFASVVGLWLSPSLLDESTIDRTLLLIFVCLLLGVNFLFYIGSMIVHARLVAITSVFTSFYSPYYLGSVLVGVLEVFLVSFFYRASRDIDILDSSTFSDPTNFRSIIVYRDITCILLSAWIIRTFTFAYSLSNAIRDTNYSTRAQYVARRTSQ